MTVSEWIAVIGLAFTALSGLAAWMYRLDRSLTRVTSLLEALQDANRSSAEDRNRLWQRLDQLRASESRHGQRITRLETILDDPEFES